MVSTKWIILNAVLAVASGSGCLEHGDVSVIVQGSPTANTPAILRALKQNNMTATFAIDMDKLSFAGTSSLLNKIIADGHLVGLSFGKLDLNAMTSEGLRGTLESHVDEFSSICSRKPLLVRVPAAVSQDKLDQLEGAGYFVVKADYDLSYSEKGCFNQTTAKLGERAIWGSLKVVLPDSETSCKGDELIKSIEAIGRSGLRVVGLDKCVGLQSAYREVLSSTPVDFSLNDPQPRKQDIARELPVGKRTVGCSSGSSLRATLTMSSFVLVALVLNII